MPVGTLLSRLPAFIKEPIKSRIFPKLLADGAVAPEWHLQAQDGEWHRQGVHWSVMVFLPADTTRPVVASTLTDLAAHHRRLSDLGLRTFVVMPAESGPLTRIVDELKLPFPLLTDRGASVARMFRAAMQLPLKSIQIPTLYLINPDRKVRLSKRGQVSVEELVQAVESLQVRKS